MPDIVSTAMDPWLPVKIPLPYTSGLLLVLEARGLLFFSFVMCGGMDASVAICTRTIAGLVLKSNQSFQEA